MNPTNPFKKRKPHDVPVEDALSSVFDDPAVGEMMRRMTDAPKQSSKLDMTRLSADIERKMEELKNAYIDFATRYGLGGGQPKKWVNNTFEFRPDGVRVEGNLVLDYCEMNELPPQLVSVGGYMTIAGNNLSSLKGMPRTVGGYLDIGSNPLETLEGLPSKIGGQFFPQKIPAKKMPTGIDISNYIYINQDQTELIDSARAGGYTVKIHTPLN